ncbi:MAG: Hsp20 family protein [Rhodospirillaceae bacterium]
MTTYDFSPLFRSTVGFDRLARLMDATMRSNGNANGYPPYDIAAVGESHYRISKAVAGFGEDDLNVEARDQTLTVTGKMAAADDDMHYLHRGIAERDFVRNFQLADHVYVADARLQNGLLTIDLERRLPEAMKPRTVKIELGAPKSLAEKAKKLLEGTTRKKAA